MIAKHFVLEKYHCSKTAWEQERGALWVLLDQFCSGAPMGQILHPPRDTRTARETHVPALLQPWQHRFVLAVGR